MTKMKWDWVLLVTVRYGEEPDEEKTFAIGPFNNQPAAHDYQSEWLTKHEVDFPHALSITFDATKLTPPQ